MIIFTFIRSLISYILLAFIIIIYAVPLTIFLLLPERWRYNKILYYLIVHSFYKAIVWCTLLPITIRGAEHISKEHPAIIAANHQSSIDIPLVGSLLKGFPHIWLAKKELFDLPLLHFILPRAAVSIDIDSPQKAMRSLVMALNAIKDKPIDAIIFPEGGRYTDGSVHDFYSGFVILARKTGRPVVPVRIFNLGAVYPPGSFLAYPHPVTVIVGEPIKMRENESDEAFKQRVYDWFVSQTEE